MSDYLFLGQTKARIKMTLYEQESGGAIDLSDASGVKIHYQKPSGATGSWTAAVLEAISGTIYYDFPAGASPLDELGFWLLWAKVTYNDTRELPSLAVRVRVISEGTLEV